MKGFFRRSVSFVFAMLMVFHVSLSYAWWEAGHMLVANIAYHHLNAKAKEEVDKLLKQFYIENTSAHDYGFNEQNPVYTMMKVSVWPDDIKASPNFLNMVNAWHYISHPYSHDETKIPKIQYAHSVVWAINRLQKHLSQVEANTYDKSRSLSYLIHLVGDIHQPLHCAELYSSQFPQGDMGGNKYDILYQESDGVKLTNLHALWDSALALYPSMGFPYNEVRPDAIDAMGKRVMEDFPLADFGDKAFLLSPEAWEKESHEMAEHAHEISFGSVPSAKYIEEYTYQVERRIALAGYRLANLLNSIYGNAASQHSVRY